MLHTLGLQYISLEMYAINLHKPYYMQKSEYRIILSKYDTEATYYPI